MRSTIIFLSFLTASIAIFVILPAKALAANCGGATVCSCGDTVTASTTLSGNLTCTGDGLIVGANNITIDGNGYTLTGDNGVTDYGIKNTTGKTNVIVKNFGNITTFGQGIYFLNASNTQFTNNTINSNNSRGFGIFLSSSPSSTLTSNTMSGNGANLFVEGAVDSDLNLSINTTNLVEGRPVYYLYSTSSQTYDGDVVGNIGMFWCISCTNVIVKNTTLSPKNRIGVYFKSSSSSTISNITATSSNYGISVDNSTTTLITSNTANFNGYGIYVLSSVSSTLTSNIADSNSHGINLTRSSSNTLSGNTESLNMYGIYLGVSTSTTITNGTTTLNNVGIYLDHPSSTTVSGNKMANNINDIFYTGVGLDGTIYSSNQFTDNIGNKMLNFTEGARTKNLNDSINFNISMFTPASSTCSVCSATITTSPGETVTSTQSSNNVTGSFTATRQGLYSLKFIITDGNNNTAKRNYNFFVGATSSVTTRFYYRQIYPDHGQPMNYPKGSLDDSYSLLQTAPTSTEISYCAFWVQVSPNEIPNYPLASISGINNYVWYKSDTSPDKSDDVGVKRYVDYGGLRDFSQSVSPTSNYTLANNNFTGLDWGLDYLSSWYWLELYLGGGNPSWQSTPTNPSYTDFTYTYNTTPTIKSASNENVNILSATAPASGTSTVNIVLDNPNSTATSTSITLGGYNHPFSGLTNAISSDSSNVFTVSNIAANSTTSLDSVNMAITPSIGSVNVTIDTWRTSGEYYKKWTENVAYGNIVTNHVVGNMNPGAKYNLKVDGAIIGNNTASGAGEISFGYNHTSYGTKTFELVASSRPGGGSLPMEVYSWSGSSLTGGIKNHD